MEPKHFTHKKLFYMPHLQFIYFLHVKFLPYTKFSVQQINFPIGFKAFNLGHHAKHQQCVNHVRWTWPVDLNVMLLGRCVDEYICVNNRLTQYEF